MFVPQGPTIPASVSFSDMYVSLAKIKALISSSNPIQQEIVLINGISSVAITVDGLTAAVGVPSYSSSGAVYIYVNNGSNWVLQAGPLVGTGATGNAAQGTSVAISGNTVVVGGSNNNSDAGAIWIFTRSGTSWTQLAGPLVGTGAMSNAQQGHSVAISDDQTTIVSGGFNDNSGLGAAWIFVYSGGTYIQQTKLVATGYIGTSYIGFSVGITGQAPSYTVILGAPYDNDFGAAWIFVGIYGIWTQQTKLIPTDVVGSDPYFGWSVAINGSTAICGGPYDNDEIGATWVFDFDGIWTQTQKIIGTGITWGDSYQGYGQIALSQDGSTMMIGGPYDTDDIGALWIFKLINNVWVQQGTKFVTNINTVSLVDFTTGLACSGNGNVVVASSGNSVYFITFPA